MALVYYDRVQETTNTTGTGTYTLAGAVTGYQSFAVVGNGNTCYYAATDGTDWEVGLGTYTASGTTLARTSVSSSSNANAAVSWSAGAKSIWLDFPALVASYLAGGTTGSGAVVLATSPALTTPNLGTPSAATLTNATGLPIGAGTTGTLAETRGGTNQTTYTTGDLLYASGSNTLAKRAIGTTGQFLTVSGGVSVWSTFTDAIEFVIDGGGSTITTGIKGDLEVPYGCTITQWTLLADQSGSIVVDIWMDTYANYPPTNADSITASAKPTISTATKGQSSALTGWTTAITAGNTLRFNVDSVTTIQRATLSLKVTR